MSYWTWDPALNLGIDIIDAQHRHIVDFINKLYDAHVTRDGILVSQALIGLADYTLTHFAFEEELLRLAKYPLGEQHKAVHAAFTARIDEYRKQHERDIDVARPLMAELKIWLTQHINHEDKQYVLHIRSGLNKSWLNNAGDRFFGP